MHPISPEFCHLYLRIHYARGMVRCKKRDIKFQYWSHFLKLYHISEKVTTSHSK
jgi:hypothetical protein